MFTLRAESPFIEGAGEEIPARFIPIRVVRATVLILHCVLAGRQGLRVEPRSPVRDRLPLLHQLLLNHGVTHSLVCWRLRSYGIFAANREVAEGAQQFGHGFAVNALIIFGRTAPLIVPRTGDREKREHDRHGDNAGHFLQTHCTYSATPETLVVTEPYRCLLRRTTSIVSTEERWTARELQVAQMQTSYPPFTIGSQFRVLPPQSPPSSDGRTDIWVTRGAFGSGEHETTASCLEVLESLPTLAGSRVLDLGSGTGILTIAAMKLGAERAVCVDIDPDAVHTAVRCCELNGVDGVEHVCGTLDDVKDEAFDHVLANIYGDILLENASHLVDVSKLGATLLLSGILWEDNYDVRECYGRLGCVVVSNRLLETYSTIVLTKT